MIGRRPSKQEDDKLVEPRGFDDFELRLGDLMRGERATMGKSLLDVQRELRIKAAYIAAIENCDPEAFDTPGFIAGYVRSYARYLNMDPDKAFAAFCAESGFSVAHGMSAEASVVRKPSREERLQLREGGDIFAAPATPFVPTGEALLSRVEPGAIGSMLVLVGLIGAIGFGGWTVLQEVQRVQVAPVEQTPVVLSDLDPLSGAAPTQPQDVDIASGAPATLDTPALTETRQAGLDRLYRPQALDVPVLVSRDGPIASLDPREYSNFANSTPDAEAQQLQAQGASADGSAADVGGVPVPRVVEDIGPTIRMVAAYPSWVRVRSAEGNVLFEGIMEPGDTWDVPATEAPPTLRTGESGAIYFAMGTDCFGPVGDRGSVTSNFELDRVQLAEAMQPVDPENAQDALNLFLANAGGLGANADEVIRGVLAKLPCQPG